MELNTSFSASVRDLIACATIVHCFPCKLNAFVSPQHTSQSQTLKRTARSAMFVEHEQSVTSAGLTSCPCEDLWGPAGQGHASHVRSST